MRLSKIFKIKYPHFFKSQLLEWCSNYQVYAYHNTNGFNLFQTKASLFPEYDILAAVGVMDSIKCNHGIALKRLRECMTKEKDWYFGILGYDLKNEIEKLTSENIDNIEFPDLQFFRPELIFLIKDSQLEILYPGEVFNETEIERIFQKVSGINPALKHQSKYTRIRQRISRESYLEKLSLIKDHISRGDIFEMNFCLEFYAEKALINPISLYKNLMEFSPSPFSCIYRFNHKYLISSSPERYLHKHGSIITAQPMKGTIRRDMSGTKDELLRNRLKNDPKEIAENIMIVDLVRNDLSRTAAKESVHVEELCGIYSYATVHQMVSTIRSELSPEFDAIDAIKNSFPMGSMTGAPKVRAMQLIEEFEETRRGIYSGAAGFFTPDSDFDFNVIIRSILYNKTNRYLSFTTGSAITANSVPELEYEECLLKAEALKKALDYRS